MKLPNFRSIRTRTVALVVLALAGAGAGIGVFAGPRAFATLGFRQVDMLQHAVNDRSYGTVLASELDQVFSLSYSVSSKVSNAITVTMTAKDTTPSTLGGPKAFTTQAGFYCYLSDDAVGRTLTATATTSPLTMGPNGLVIEQVANKAAWAVVNSNGVVDFKITQTATKNYFLACMLPTDKLSVSPVIAF